MIALTESECCALGARTIVHLHGARRASRPQLEREPLGRATKSVVRKIIVYIATSADGYIARPDGNVD